MSKCFLFKEGGFTLIELIVVIAIMAILSTIATLQFNKWSRKAALESQMKMIHMDMVETRLKAMLEKTPMSIKFLADQFMVYPGTDASGAPMIQRKLGHPLMWGGAGSELVLSYDTRGLVNKLVSICADTAEDDAATVDAIVVSRLRTRMGKREAGKYCSAVFIASQ